MSLFSGVLFILMTKVPFQGETVSQVPFSLFSTFDMMFAVLHFDCRVFLCFLECRMQALKEAAEVAQASIELNKAGSDISCNAVR